MSASNSERIDWEKFQELAPDVVASFRAVTKSVNTSGLDHALLELVKIRASQINGCAFCIEMHAVDARTAGVSDEKLLLVSVWREAHDIFTDDECAALAWTESLTNIAGNDVSDELYALVKSRFDDKQIANLTATVALINAWNRIAKPLRYSLSGKLK